eukprot:jgi/Botrbrau1/3552/Bobra.0078s0009.1
MCGGTAIAVQLQVDPKECIRRCERRVGHATVSPDQAASVVMRMASSFQAVSSGEGFAENYRVRRADDIDDLIGYLGPARVLQRPGPSMMGAPSPAWSPGPAGGALAIPSLLPQQQLFAASPPGLPVLWGPSGERSFGIPFGYSQPGGIPLGYPGESGPPGYRRDSAGQYPGEPVLGHDARGRGPDAHHLLNHPRDRVSPCGGPLRGYHHDVGVRVTPLAGSRGGTWGTAPMVASNSGR